MRYLLDTHVLIWTLTDTKKLPAKVRSLLEDPNNDFFVSAVTLWEMAIKIRNGRLEPFGKWDNALPYIKQLGFQTLPLSPDDAASSGRLKEDTHFDPFDRMLIWQAIQLDLVLLSGDKEFKKFKSEGLRLSWK
jgi:PIN domain nuclease of toxin-antitoxin system